MNQTDSSRTKRPFKDILFSVEEFNKRFKTDAKFKEFAMQVYNYLDNMKVGHFLRLDRYQGEKLEWIILTASAFMAESVHSLEYVFSDDYQQIRHNYVRPDIIKTCLAEKYGDLTPDNYDK